MEEKDNLGEITGIQVPCAACKDKDSKPCEFCPYWQFAQLAYFKLKMDPMGSIAKIIKQDKEE
jgi:hypothetical protein